MPTKLIEFATAQGDHAVLVQEAAKADHAAAQAALAQARGDLEQAVSQLRALEEEIAQDRAALAESALPAEVEALLAKLTADTVAFRRKSLSVADRRAALARANVAVAAAGARMEAASSQVSRAQAQLAREARDDERRTRWQSAVGDPSLAGLPARCGAILAGTDDAGLLAKAQAKLDTDPVRVPQPLLDLAEERYAVWRNRQKLAQDAVEAAQDALGARAFADAGLPGRVRREERLFRRAEKRLGAFVGSATARYQRAVSSLEALANLGDGVFALGAAEAAQANDPELSSAREDAAVTEAAVRPLQRALDVAASVLANAQLTDAAGLTTDAAATAQTGFNTAQAALDGALAAWGVPEQEVLADWQVRLVDGTWRRILEFVRARAELAELRDLDPPALVAAVAATEQTLAQALAASSQSTERLEALERERALREATFEAMTGELEGRFFGAVRGDDN